MTTDTASLARLHDIVVPPPVPWWPPAPGWLWLLAFAVLVTLALSIRGFIHWQQNRYRREALAELAGLESPVTDGATRAVMIEQMSVILKRTALTAYGREPVAALTGADWFAFLDRTGGTRFGNGLGAAMENAIYRPGVGRAGPVNVPELAREIRSWIREHAAVTDLPATTAVPARPRHASADRKAA
jgi:hypothetical protein